ncbi:unnamed protein product [Amoebophrya sp. A120]|nr:unnamed protein product [Amoebophrya sp. A120]|eukprot:GSA120T00022006001.1
MSSGGAAEAEVSASTMPPWRTFLKRAVFVGLCCESLALVLVWHSRFTSGVTALFAEKLRRESCLCFVELDTYYMLVSTNLNFSIVIVSASFSRFYDFFEI